MITFPCSPYDLALGAPNRAGHCHCTEGPWQTDTAETCLRCGHHVRQTIDQTWSDRARVIALHPRRHPGLNQDELRVAFDAMRVAA